MSERPALFTVTGLRAVFDGREVLSLDSLRLEEGLITVLVGENGSGKTTLLRLLNGLIAPSAGCISYRGTPIEQDRMRLLRAQSVLLHQAPILFRGTVLQNVSYGLRVRSMPPEEALRRSRRALSRVRLEGMERRRVASLSGGEKQRVALARALALEPRVLLLDEPTAHVDPEARELVEALLREIAAGGTTVVMSTHAMELAYRLGDRLVRLEAGRIAPVSDNILKGAVERTDEDFTYFRSGGLLLRCPARAGPFSVAVVPFDELILSRGALDSSARNQARGTVTGVEQREGLLVVTVECGATLRALLTRAAAVELGVETGLDCVVTFKASAVRLY